jgi:D-glycero-D-manno-heptose 1,7-bisphosphate phosphatase
MEHRLDAVFLDRDGTINVKAPEGEYITGPEQLRLLPGAAEGIRRLNRAGVPVIVITNQRGIALGRMDETDLAAVHARLRELLGDQDAQVDGILHCPHEKGTCECRKPGTLMLRLAQDSLGLTTLRHCLMIGDSSSDVEAGRRAGARTVLLAPSGPALAKIEVAPTLLAAVTRELSDHGLAEGSQPVAS